MAETQTISVNDIPTIQRGKKSESFIELDSKLKLLKPNQAFTQLSPRTKKGDLNRQYSTKISKHLGNGWTVVSRMGNPELKLEPRQLKEELYVYIYRTPQQIKS